MPAVGMLQQQSTSLPSPVAATFAAAWGSGAPGGGDTNSGSVNGQRDSVSGSVVSREDREKEQDKDKERVGLGLVVQEEERTHRPPHLSLSPSDGTLSDQVHLVNGDDVVEEEDRGHVSEVRFFSVLNARRDSHFRFLS